VYELRDKAIGDKGMTTMVRVLRGDVEIGLGEKSQMRSGKKAS
jgi:hypothetical protein